MASNKNRKPKKQLKNVAVLTSVAIQMGITIYLFVRLGEWLDSKYNNDNKLFLIIFTLLGVAISMYALVKQLNRLNND